MKSISPEFWGLKTQIKGPASLVPGELLLGWRCHLCPGSSRGLFPCTWTEGCGVPSFSYTGTSPMTSFTFLTTHLHTQTPRAQGFSTGLLGRSCVHGGEL